MKLTREQVYELNHILANTDFKMPISSRFRYTVTKNIKATKAEIDAINEAFEEPEELSEYNSKRGAILNEFSVNTDEEYKNLEESVRSNLDAKIKELDDEYSELINQLRELDAERLEFLKEEVDIDLKTIKLDDMPDISDDNKYPHWQIWGILELIVEDK